MTEATYRIGRSQPPGACVRHPGVPVAFQCHECLDSLCEGCRGPGRRNRCCRICHEAVAQRERGEPASVVVRPPRSRWRLAIVGLTVANVVFGATLTGSLLLQPAASAVERSVTDVETLNRIVESSRDATGLVPAEVERLLDRVPADVAERVRSRAIRYRPSPDRRSFELVASPGQRR